MSGVVKTAFETFFFANDAHECLSAFHALTVALNFDRDGGPAAQFFPRLRAALLDAKQLPFKYTSFLAALDERFARVQDLRAKNAPKKLVVSGGGPCGLRAAVEAAMLGFDVTILEKRTNFSRHNIIKTWQGTIDDLWSFGLPLYLQRPATSGAPAITVAKHGLLHLGTREIQLTLFKTALLFGVAIRLDHAVVGIVDPALATDGSPAGTWRVMAVAPSTRTASYQIRWPAPVVEQAPNADSGSDNDEPAAATAAPDAAVADAATTAAPPPPPELSLLKPGEQDATRLKKKSKVDYIETAISKDGGIMRTAEDVQARLTYNAADCSVSSFECDSLLMAEGETSRLVRHLGFDRKVARYGPAIGIVVNLEFSPEADAAERRLPEFVVSRVAADWRSSVLGTLNSSGILLENIEYMRGSTHFIVATVMKESLLAYGVLKQLFPDVKDCLAPANVSIGSADAAGDAADQLESDPSADPKATRTLYRLARLMARGCGIPDSAPFSRFNGVQIFDFSCKGRITYPFRMVEPAGGSGPRLLVQPIGDALQNPYWPQGLGVNKGFQMALDALWMAYLHASQQEQQDEDQRPAFIKEREMAAKVADWRPLVQTALAPAQGWTADPATRYVRQIFADINMTEIEGKFYIIPYIPFTRVPITDENAPVVSSLTNRVVAKLQIKRNPKIK